ncbi:ester cyclase [Angustibacter sp. McL0619]|uniref:ester cyclase n=1 Tax=Angustibacter sp. McL0619 TaxID=3415676 RepID=UPI003CF69D43
MSVEENKAVVQRLVEMVDTLELDSLEEVLSPELAGEWREVLTTLPFSDHHMKITDIVGEGDQVAIRVATSGVHSGEWEGVPATGKRWTNVGFGLARLDGGKIVAEAMLFDELDHLKQLGATIVPPASNG